MTASQLPLDRESLRTNVDDCLQKLFAGKVDAAEDIDPVYGLLVRELQSFIAQPGAKRQRPYMTYLAYVGYGGDSMEAILPVAAATELYHNFLLIHDDIIDRDLTRYGAKNVTGKYLQRFGHLPHNERRHYADSVAMLGGDLNYSLTVELILDSRLEASLQVALLRRLTRSAFEVLGGQLVDVVMPIESDTQFTADRITQVMRYKTASYSFATPLQLGAIMAGASADQQLALAAFAEPLGIAFQIRDDVLDIWGDEATIGKPVMSDIRSGKHTLLLAYALEMASASQRTTLMQLIGNPNLTTRDQRTVQAILTECGALDKVEHFANSLTDKAISLIASLEISSAVGRALSELAHKSSTRSK